MLKRCAGPKAHVHTLLQATRSFRCVRKTPARWCWPGEVAGRMVVRLRFLAHQLGQVDRRFPHHRQGARRQDALFEREDVAARALQDLGAAHAATLHDGVVRLGVSMAVWCQVPGVPCDLPPPKNAESNSGRRLVTPGSESKRRMLHGHRVFSVRSCCEACGPQQCSQSCVGGPVRALKTLIGDVSRIVFPATPFPKFNVELPRGVGHRCDENAHFRNVYSNPRLSTLNSGDRG